jgi:hypothetical protein
MYSWTVSGRASSPGNRTLTGGSVEPPSSNCSLTRRTEDGGYGRHLSALLAKALPLPDDEFLMGTIHTDNHPPYRAALSAGRVDGGGEIVIPL